ncbi:MAG: aminotransferase class I/II-fold pyridoxal phosphate-dependent enzyme [Firmicutes bacterium]|nr:aminotransferase class I/II-fold pyridoxal phosphate-dependent enzyme [Bacillota bacterium]
MEQSSAPLWEQLKQFQEKERIWLHVPAHSGGFGLPLEMATDFSTYARFDLTELPGLDDLHHPSGVIAQAQALAAQVWQAKQSYFLVNGASAGVRAMVLATCNPGDTILIPRNAHGSLYHALVFSGAIPRYLPIAEGDGFPLNVTVEAVSEGFKRYPEAKALFLTSPSYFGVTANIGKIAAIVRQAKAYLLVDEAHGGHLDFSVQLPSSAALFCDMRVQSWHKTLGALTPGAVLHCHSERVDKKRLLMALHGVQTSSPPYPLLASLDLVRQRMALTGEEVVQSVVATAATVRKLLASHFPLLTREDVKMQGFDLDVTRITLLTAQVGLSGIDIGHQLASKGIDIELALPDCVLAIVGLGYKKEGNRRLATVLDALIATKGDVAMLPLPDLPELVLTPRQAAYRRVVGIQLSEAEGSIAATTVVSYPPGIPLLLPGERISCELIGYIENALECGVILRGLDNCQHIQVCKDEVSE